MRSLFTISAAASSAILLFSLPTIASAQAPFGGVSAYPSGFTPRQIILGDFNNDGYDDAVYSETTNGFFTNAIAIQPGAPGGGFGIYTNIFVGPLSTTIGPMVAADFNNDGNLDLYEARKFDNHYVILGNGSGGFGAQMPLTTITGSGTIPKVAASDQNNDGNCDILLIESWVFGTLTSGVDANIFFGNGNGTFGGAVGTLLHSIATGSGPSAGAFAVDGADFNDINNDGRLDTAVVTNLKHSTGPGTGDKYQDLIISLSNGSGVFGPAIFKNIFFGSQFSTTPPAQIPFLIDANGDGNRDVLLTLGKVYLGAGDGNVTLFPSVSIPIPGVFRSADLNQDGLSDIEVLRAPSELLIQVGQGAPFPTAPVDYVGFPSSFDFRTTDLDQDGKLDFVFTASATHQLLTMKGNGDGGVQAVPAFDVAGTLTFGNSNAICITSADFNLDGKRDAILCDATTVRISLGDGAGGFGPSNIILNSSGITACASGDLNRDGYLDIVVVSDTTNSAELLFGAAGGIFTNGGSFATGGGPVAAALGDIDGDGFLDLITGNAAGNSISYFINTNPGFTTNAEIPAGGTVNQLAIGDLNEDGLPDAVVSRSTVSSVGVFLASPPGFAAFTNFTTSAPPIGVAIGDVNNDDHLDIATVNSTTNASLGASLLLGDGTGALGGATAIASISVTTNLPRQAILADLGGDGFLDLTAVGVGNVGRIWNNNQTGLLTGPTVFGGVANATNPRDRAVVADFNADGRHDLLALGDTTSTLNKNATPAPYGTLAFGIGTPGCAGAHGIAANVAPRIDTPGFMISSTNGPPRMLGLGLFGDMNYPLGADAFGLGFTTYVDPYLSNPLGYFEFVTDRNGAAYGVVPIGNSNNLIGLTFTAQTFLLWTDGCLPTFLGLSSSRALQITIQN